MVLFPAASRNQAFRVQSPSLGTVSPLTLATSAPSFTPVTHAPVPAAGQICHCTPVNGAPDCGGLAQCKLKAFCARHPSPASSVSPCGGPGGELSNNTVRDTEFGLPAESTAWTVSV